MTAKYRLDVVIVGAGIGGLGAAIAIRNAGHHVTVLEQAPEFVEVGDSVRARHARMPLSQVLNIAMAIRLLYT